MKHLALIAALLVCSTLGAKPLGVAAGRGASGGGGGGFVDAPLPSGASSFTAENWLQVAGASGYIVYCATSSQLYPDGALYPYQYVVSSGATLSKAVTGVASGTYYVRIAAYAGSTIYDLGPEVAYSAP